MPETRDTKQYKIYSLFATVDVVIGKKGGKDVVRTDRVPMAVFDDKKLCDKFQKDNTTKMKGQTGYEVVEEWRDMVPEQSHFSYRFNPKPNEVELTEKVVNKRKTVVADNADGETE